MLPLCPRATHLLSSSYFDLERERWGGIKELVQNRLLTQPSSRGLTALSPSSHRAPCPSPWPPPLTVPSPCSKLSFPPPTANMWMKQHQGAELSPCSIPFPMSSRQIRVERRSPTCRAGSLCSSPALTVCHPAGPAASRPLVAPSGGPHPDPRGHSPHTDSPGPWYALFCGEQGSGPRAWAPATCMGRSPLSSAGQPGSSVTCSPGSAPVSRALPSPELQRGQLGHHPHSAGESLGMGEESQCHHHQPWSACKEGHRGFSCSLRALGRAGQAGRLQSLSVGLPLQEHSPLASWFPGWDNLSPIVYTQAETPAHNKMPRTTRTKLGKRSGAPVPNFGMSSLRGQQAESCISPLGSCFGILTNSPCSGQRCQQCQLCRPQVLRQALGHDTRPGSPSLTDLSQELLRHFHSERLGTEGRREEWLSTGSLSQCSKQGWKELGIWCTCQSHAQASVERVPCAPAPSPHGNFCSQRGESWGSHTPSTQHSSQHPTHNLLWSSTVGPCSL